MPDVLRDAGAVSGNRGILALLQLPASLRFRHYSRTVDSAVHLLHLARYARERSHMHLRRKAIHGVVVLAASVAAAPLAHGQSSVETFTATATVKTAGAASASAPVTIVVDRKMSQSEADTLTAAFKTGGATALRKALAGVPATGSVQVGSGSPTPTRLTLERPTDKGRLLTIVTDRPILFLGAGVPGAKPKEGYDFAVVDIEVDGKGSGTGTLSPAARITVKQGAFVVDDYASEQVRLVDVKKVK
jgi:hypothetical protein